MRSLKRVLNTASGLVLCGALLACPQACAQAEEDPRRPSAEKKATEDRPTDTEVRELSEIVVVGDGRVHASNQVSQPLLEQATPATSAVDVVDALPGVLVNEGDPLGFDDWSTSISMRGFALSLDEQQIGMTLDGLPNGNSNYGGGSKVTRLVDTPNLEGASVSQGTADLASFSNEALGGTLHYFTRDPLGARRVQALISAGNLEARKVFLSLDTAPFPGGTTAWVSISAQESTDFINRSAEQQRQHLAGKFIHPLKGGGSLVGYLAIDDVHEDNYQRISLEQFRQNPDDDGLTAEWTGLPWVDQLYRRAWSTLRNNSFAYLKLRDLRWRRWFVQAAVYAHWNRGRGDWVPPYLVDVVADGVGRPESEWISSSPVSGGERLGLIHFVNADGVALAPEPGCRSSITHPYGGAGPEYDPACYPADAVAVQSWRHTHYGKKRYGLTLEAEQDYRWRHMDGLFRSGLWLERYRRREHRDWHRILDTRLGPAYHPMPYWVQYAREYPVTTGQFYLENRLDTPNWSIRAGLRKVLVSLERQDRIDPAAPALRLRSDSDWLFAGGVVWKTPWPGLEAFAGYGQNFAPIKDTVLERDASAFDRVRPERADNVDLGVRYAGRGLSVSLTAYDTRFDNRIVFVGEDTNGAPDYLIGSGGLYLNYGGIHSRGLELAANWHGGRGWHGYLALTRNRSRYTGTGNPALDEALALQPGNGVYGAVEDQAVLAIDHRTSFLTAGASLKWVGPRWLDAANRQRVPAWRVLNLHLELSAARLHPRLAAWSLQIHVRNALDEDYLGGLVGGRAGWIGPGRSWMFTLAYRR